MGGARLGIYAFLVLVVLAVVAWNIERPSGVAARDVSQVYCLAPGHVDGLVDAAVALGVAGAGSTPRAVLAGGKKLPLGRWRDADAGDFERACGAYAAANMPSPPPQDTSNAAVATIANILLPVIAGALITMAADDFKQAADRRWAQADELRSDWRSLHAAVTAFAAQCASPLLDGLPSTADLTEKRRKQQQTVRKIRQLHRYSSILKRIADPIDTGMLGPGLETGWDMDATARAERAKRVTGFLGAYGADLEEAASILERKMWLNRWQ